MALQATYLPQPEKGSPWRLDLLGAGYARVRPGATYPPRGHPAAHYFEWERGRLLGEYQIILISEGGGTVETAATAPLAFSAPFCFILFPGVWHRYRPRRDSGWTEHWVAFDGPYARELQDSEVIAPERPFFEIGHDEALLAQMQLVEAEARAEAFGFRRICASAVMQILALATTLPYRRQEELQPMRAIIRKACFLMRERADQALSPEALASELNVGYTYFRRTFKRFTGMSPKRYHSQLRLLRAKALLRDAGRGVAEIAAALGFDTPFHFSSWFKKQTGRSPSDWRRPHSRREDLPRS